MMDLYSRLPSHITSKMKALASGNSRETLSLDECRTIIRTLQVMILMQPPNVEALKLALRRFSGLERLKRNRLKSRPVL